MHCFVLEWLDCALILFLSFTFLCLSVPVLQVLAVPTGQDVKVCSLFLSFLFSISLSLPSLSLPLPLSHLSSSILLLLMLDNDIYYEFMSCAVVWEGVMEEHKNDQWPEPRAGKCKWMSFMGDCVAAMFSFPPSTLSGRQCGGMVMLWKLLCSGWGWWLCHSVGISLIQVVAQVRTFRLIQNLFVPRKWKKSVQFQSQFIICVLGHDTFVGFPSANW